MVHIGEQSVSDTVYSEDTMAHIKGQFGNDTVYREILETTWYIHFNRL